MLYMLVMGPILVDLYYIIRIITPIDSTSRVVRACVLVRPVLQQNGAAWGDARATEVGADTGAPCGIQRD
jgi:hypothetical protein